MTRTYTILAVSYRPTRLGPIPLNPPEHREYHATTLQEALTMAEREDAGIADYLYGILPEDYAQARDEDIEFNEADGLLL